MSNTNIISGVVISLILVTSGQALAKTYEECNAVQKAGLIGASAVLSIPYSSVKLGYGLMGTFIAGITNGLTLKYAAPVAEKLAITSAGGDWYITPENLLREKRLQFNGSAD